MRQLVLALLMTAVVSSSAQTNLGRAFRKPVNNGWIYIHLEGDPFQIGYQHGSLLRPEIEDNKRAIEFDLTEDGEHTWNDYRKLSQRVYLPHVPAEYRRELEGIVSGVRSQHSRLDLLDIVTMNAFMEFPYELNQEPHTVAASKASIGEHCSAFIANGSYTKDGRIVIGHNNWTDYVTAVRWNIIFDIVPAHGHHITMDGMPGLIHSADDFGMNDAGIVITETTISDFNGFDRNGIPEFVRARRAMQYSESIDDFARIMRDGNNGGYANTWLIGDTKRNEIGRLELGLKNVTLDRTRDGYFVGSNFPISPKLAAEETTYPVNDPNFPDSVRHRRWDQLMAENKGRIDVDAGKRFETDHYDLITHEIDPNERTICGHVDRSSRGLKGWQAPFGPAGTAQAKVADAAMIAKLSFVAGMGHTCGTPFDAKAFLKQHPQFKAQQPYLKDIGTGAWTIFAGSAQ